MIRRSVFYCAAQIYPPTPEKPFWGWGAYKRGGGYKIRAAGELQKTPPPSPLKMSSGQHRGDGGGGGEHNLSPDFSRWCIVYPFPLFSQANSMHHSFFCSVTLGSGDRPRKEGCHSGGVYSFFPCKVATSNSMFSNEVVQNSVI